MSIANKPLCATTGYGNTGISSCNIDIAKITGIILSPKGAVLTEANMASQAAYKAALLAKTLLNDTEARYYPVFAVGDMEDTSTAATNFTYPYGQVKKSQSGKYILTFTFADGGLCRHLQLAKNNDKEFDFYLVDANNQVIGCYSGVDQKGLTGNAETMDFTFATAGGDPTKYKLMLTLDRPEELNTAGVVCVVPMGSTNKPEDIFKGLLDVHLEHQGALTAGQAKFKIFTDCGNIDITSKFGDTWEDAALFTAVKAGVAVTISSVTYDSVAKTVTLAFTNSGSIDFGLAGPTELAAAGIGGSAGQLGYECPIATTAVIPAP